LFLNFAFIIFVFINDLTQAQLAIRQVFFLA